MCHSYIKSFNDFQYQNYQVEDEVTNEEEKEAVVITEQEENNTSSSSVSLTSKSLSLSSSAMSLTLVLLGSTLVGAYEPKRDTIAPYYCRLSSYICAFKEIGLTPRLIGNEIRQATVKSLHRLHKVTNLSNIANDFVNLSIPVSIGSEGIDYRGIRRHLCVMTIYMKKNYKNYTSYENYTSSANSSDHNFCNEDIINGFCDRDYNRNTTIISKCCSDIDRYITDMVHPTTIYPTTVYTTMEATSTEYTTLAPTKAPDFNNKLTVFLSILAALLFLAAATVIFISCKRTSKKEQQRPQAVNISETEDLV
ncbi:hypothetical protein [Candidatus Ichthyocystis sparus]|uniref:hypothetical protein n=1 Tax=Candidatus Ichthyocystis sparus TaxID=1561004 RepID=UPI000B86B839|nr:hypothetical protein [Candidatus Ichthyocystis sparus]